MESACFDSTESAFDVNDFHDCASFALLSMFDALIPYLAYPVLGLQVVFAHTSHQLRCSQSTCMVHISSLLQLLTTGLLFLITVWWGTLLIILLAPAPASPGLSRHMHCCKVPAMRGFPRRWMLLSCLMLPNANKSQTHPISHFLVPLSQTLDCCIHLE